MKRLVSAAAIVLACGVVQTWAANVDCEPARCAVQTAIAARCPSCDGADNHGRYVSCVARIVRELTVTAWADAVRERNATSVCRPMRLDITMILRERRTGWCKPHATTRRPRTLKCTGGLASPADRLPYNLVQFRVVMCGPSTWVADV